MSIAFANASITCSFCFQDLMPPRENIEMDEGSRHSVRRRMGCRQLCILFLLFFFSAPVSFKGIPEGHPLPQGLKSRHLVCH
jgi:hypothetical protein